MTTHTDHPLRHWDRTCPACNGELPEPPSGFNGGMVDAYQLTKIHQYAITLRDLLAAKETDRQYHMDAINRLAKFLAFHATSDEVITAAIQNITRLADLLAAEREATKILQQRFDIEVEAFYAEKERAEKAEAELFAMTKIADDAVAMNDRQAQRVYEAESSLKRLVDAARLSHDSGTSEARRKLGEAIDALEKEQS